MGKSMDMTGLQSPPEKCPPILPVISHPSLAVLVGKGSSLFPESIYQSPGRILIGPALVMCPLPLPEWPAGLRGDRMRAVIRASHTHSRWVLKRASGFMYTGKKTFLSSGVMVCLFASLHLLYFSNIPQGTVLIWQWGIKITKTN